MLAPFFYQLVGHVYLAAHTAHDHEAVKGALQGAGLSGELIKQGLDLASRGEALLERMHREAPDNKTLEHNVHAAVSEVEIWLQTVKLKLKKASFEAREVAVATGKDLHAHDHVVSVVAQALRAIGFLRALDEAEVARVGGFQAAHDLIMRGNTLLKKLYKVADDFVTPGSLMPASHAIFKDFDKLNQALGEWIGKLEQTAEKTKSLKALGYVGTVPLGAGIPVGGAAFNVTLHQRAVTSAPDPRSADKTSGWSVGRQGNKENLGNGWMPPDYGSVTGD